MKSEVTTEIENCVRVRIGVGSNFRGRIFEIFRSFENRVNFKNNHHVSRICKNNQNSVSNFKNSHVANLKSLVNLDLRICSCRAWQSTGYPCSHALSVIQTHRWPSSNQNIRSQLPVHDYTESFFTLEAFRKTYANAIIPPSVSELGAMTTGPLPPPEPANEAEESSDDKVEIEEDDDGDNNDNNEEEESVLAPTIRRQPGRPRKERTEAEKEHRKRRRGIVRHVQKCRLCRAVGHSKRTCKGPPK